MLDPELLALLVCPQTHQDVTLAPTEEIAALNEAILGGQVRTAGGERADKAVAGALIRADRAVAYPIREGFPVMLISEGLVIGHLDLRTGGKVFVHG